MALVQFCDYRGKTKADMKSHSRVHFREVEKQIGKRRGTEKIYNRSLSPVPSLAAISPVELPSHWLATRCDH